MKFSTYVKCILIFAVLVAFNGFNSACSVNGTGVTQTWLDVEVGPDGGEIVGSMGSIIIIPQGALEEWTTITIEEIPSDEIPEHSGYRRISSGLLLKPEGLTFKKPVSLYIPYADYDYSISQQKSNIAMFTTAHIEKENGYADGDADTYEAVWEKLEGSVDVGQKVSRAETSHFSIFAVYYKEGQEEDGDSDAETEDLCECKSLAGKWILMSASICSESKILEVTKANDECTLLASMKDGFENTLKTFSVKDCEFPVSLQMDELTDCKLRYESEVDNILMECSECSQIYTREQ